jgi:hypothetical protein
MADRMQFPESDPRHHTLKIQDLLVRARDHCREDVGKITDPKAQAIFETTAEVLDGLIRAYDHYNSRSEQAMR